MECLLPESLDISTVLDSASQYKSWLAQHEQLKIDASHVGRVDAAGIQALASLFHSARSNQITIQLVRPTPSLVEGIITLGLDGQFDINTEVGEG
ncbi:MULTISPECIES: STAS domain-containing protein [Vibrio]|uniref:Anti-anti-sigma factor n=1 Tax=Vibrio bivalvicida TaxID=1276888 RepID=A0A177Y1K9_9VIBR|nr:MULTISPECIES: STAS domain-containing protein [Vibrio]KLN63924.1 anti-anti-sigma regulatory factor [Vibrio sp. VPAP30]OAJ94711.1 anti-anti-sigma factor [Vibrio bivalvicida]